LGIADHHHLCILIQVLVRLWPGSYRREYRPLQNPLPSRRTSHLLGIRTPFDPSNPPQTSPPPTDCYRPAILLCGPLRTRSTRYKALPPATSFFSTLYTPLRTVIRPPLPATSPSHLLQATLTYHGLLLTLYTLCKRPMLQYSRHKEANRQRLEEVAPGSRPYIYRSQQLY
jgi:hypothetical protein